MKNFEELINFINSNPNDWINKLKSKPYNLRSVVQFPNNPNWYVLVYDLLESDLNDKIVRQCRGTAVEVVDGKAKIICAPYLKFFDINDGHADTINWDSPLLKCEDKCDGQLIKMFKYKGRDYWITNGSAGLYTPIDYKTDDVKDYKDLMEKALLAPFKDAPKCIKTEDDFYCKMEWVDKVPDGWTLMFELTSPQNKIICDYSETKLWFHGVRDADGIEHSPEEAKKMFNIPYDIPKRYNLSSRDEILSALEKFNGKHQEGFVVVDEENWTRVKMKCPSYLALKYIREHDNPEGIWRLCICESHDDYPELKEKTDKQVEEIKAFKRKFISTMNYAKDVWENDYNKNRKKFALWVTSQVPSALRPIYFKAADGKVSEEYLNELWNSWKEKSKGYETYCSIKDALHIDFSIPHSEAERELNLENNLAEFGI